MLKGCWVCWRSSTAVCYRVSKQIAEVKLGDIPWVETDNSNEESIFKTEIS